VSATVRRAWPVARVALRSTALIAVTVLLIFVVFPAVLSAAVVPQVPIGG
jgi:hypothetical protein